MIIIRKLLSLFIVLVVITSLSVTAFAAGEQPSGSSYQYYNGTTTTNYDTFWSAMSKGLVYIGQQIRQINSYFSSNNNWLSTINANLNDIKLAVDPTSSSSNFAHPSGTNYSYYTFQDTTSSSNFWVAINSQLQYLSNRVNSIENKVIDYSTILTSIQSSASYIRTHTSNTATNTSAIASSSASIDTSTQNMNTNLAAIYQSSNVVTHPYMAANERISAGNSNYNFWWAVSTSLSYIGSDLDLARKSLDAMVPDLDDLHTMFASPEDLALKADQENNISAATSNFLSGSDSSTSVGTQSIGKVKDLGDDAATWFDTGVQATSLFDALSNDDADGPWMWFTKATMDDLDSTNPTRSSKGYFSPGEYVPDLYGAKMDELNRMLNAFSD